MVVVLADKMLAPGSSLECFVVASKGATSRSGKGQPVYQKTRKDIELKGPRLMETAASFRRKGTLLYVLSIVLFLIGIGGFGTASAGDVEMFGVTIEAKYACFIYFVLGGLSVWSSLEAKRRGRG